MVVTAAAAVAVAVHETVVGAVVCVAVGAAAVADVVVNVVLLVAAVARVAVVLLISLQLLSWKQISLLWSYFLKGSQEGRK